ncbi:hypothetical protein L3D22_07385 [Lysobacter soli]|uniref:hypothetical protein n=1 Tax=Lysobacter soli TaxID=453783 RepID=UPI00209CCF9D|nr:hypothetical protein [Lysobacter soli]UTA55616.1 hypothetical protein L3D22_07385 [Lysobacter soli]
MHGIANGAALLSGWATDVVASSAVTGAGMLELWFESPYQDFAIGTLTGVHVIKEAIATQDDAHGVERVGTPFLQKT